MTHSFPTRRSSDLPDDPVVEARLDAIRRAGGNPFRDEQLPQAVIALKQGVGRLIRTETDRGVLVLCDPRLLGKSYGKLFLRSEEHTSELQLLMRISYAVFCLKKKNKNKHKRTTQHTIKK